MEKELVRIDKDKYEVKEKPLWWQLQGFQQTSSGYGSKLATRHMLKYEGRWHRIYCAIFSNIGTCYIIAKGQNIIVD